MRCKTEGQAAVMFDSRALLREGGGTAAAALKPGQGNTRTISGGVERKVRRLKSCFDENNSN